MKLALEYVRPSALRIDRQYQRPINIAFASRIAREYRAEDFGVIICSRRADGALYVLDGQHRIAAVIQKGWAEKAIPAMVYEDLSMAQEAEMFTAQTKSRGIHPIDLYKAKLFASDKRIMAVDKIVTDCGFEVKNDAWWPNIRAPQSVIDIYERVGPDRLKEVLTLISLIWENERKGPPAYLIQGINAFLIRYEPVYNRDRFIEVMKTVSHAKVDEMAGAMRKFFNDRAGTLYGRALREVYNGKLREANRLPPWDIALLEAHPSQIGPLRARKANEHDDAGVGDLPIVREATA